MANTRMRHRHDRNIWPRRLWAMSASAPRTWTIGRAMAPASSACSASTRSRSSLAFRMDDRKQRIIVDADGGEGISFFGWEVADAAALDALAAHLDEQRHQGRARRPRARRRAPRAGSDRVRRSARQSAGDFSRRRNARAEPFKPGRSISGFRTGPLGLGHVVLNVDSTARPSKS